MAEKRNVQRPESNRKDFHLDEKEVYKTKKIPDVINLWGIAGRQEIMEMRRLWQIRIPRK
jgi:hypothetical protein